MDRQLKELQSKPSKGYLRIFMVVILTGALTADYFLYEKQAAKPAAEPLEHSGAVTVLAQDKFEIPQASLSLVPEDLEFSADKSIAEQVNEVTTSVTGTFGIAVKNLVTGETFYQRSDEPFIMASIFKPPLVLTSLLMLENDALSQDIKIGYLPLMDANEQIVGRSEEELAEMLASIIGWDKVQVTAKKYGMKNTHFNDEFDTTPRDQVAFLENVYKGKNMPQTVRDRMFNLLVRQQINDRIPKYLPNNLTIAHKTGELDNARHDVGIVTDGKTTYVIALMSKDLGSPEAGKEVEAKLSYIFYRHFFKPNT